MASSIAMILFSLLPQARPSDALQFISSQHLSIGVVKSIISYDNRYLLIGTFNAEIIIFDATTSKVVSVNSLLQKLEGETHSIYKLVKIGNSLYAHTTYGKVFKFSIKDVINSAPTIGLFQQVDLNGQPVETIWASDKYLICSVKGNKFIQIDNTAKPKHTEIDASVHLTEMFKDNAEPQGSRVLYSELITIDGQSQIIFASTNMLQVYSFPTMKKLREYRFKQLKTIPSAAILKNDKCYILSWDKMLVFSGSANATNIELKRDYNRMISITHNKSILLYKDSQVMLMNESSNQELYTMPVGVAGVLSHQDNVYVGLDSHNSRDQAVGGSIRIYKFTK